MKKLILFLTLISTTIILAQPIDDRSPWVPPPDMSSSNLPQTIASGVNYYSFIPLSSGAVQLRIENLTTYPNDVLLVGDDGSGNRETRILKVKAEGFLTVAREDLESYDHIYLISMQPFYAQSDTPVSVMGITTRHFTTITPSRHLELHLVENIRGKGFMVGVTPDLDVHYPVYGFKFGSYDRENKTINRENGSTYDVLQR